MKKLKDLGLIETKMKDFPKKRYIRIGYERLKQLLIQPDYVVEPPPKESIKETFYSNINNNISQEYSIARDHFGNIPEDIKQFMYAWSSIYQRVTHTTWSWDSVAYGQISHYWKETYGRYKKFDYSSLLRFFKEESSIKESLPDFIDIDRIVPEKHPEKKLTFSNFIDTINAGGISEQNK